MIHSFVPLFPHDAGFNYVRVQMNVLRRTRMIRGILNGMLNEPVQEHSSGNKGLTVLRTDKALAFRQGSEKQRVKAHILKPENASEIRKTRHFVFRHEAEPRMNHIQGN